jgi:hypothetical protein
MFNSGMEAAASGQVFSVFGSQKAGRLKVSSLGEENLTGKGNDRAILYLRTIIWNRMR